MIRLICLVATLLIAGCATAPNAIRLTDGSSEKVVRSISIDPVMFSGMPWTSDLKHGNFVTVLGRFPQTQEAYAEWDPLRIRYQAHAVSTSGTEYVAHAMFAGFPPCSQIPVSIIFVEGLKRPTAEVKVITLSTLLDRAYRPDGTEIKGFEAAKFQTSAAYRRDFVLANGGQLASLRQIADVDQAFRAWSVYKTPSGEIITPLEPQKVKYLSGINPQYSYWEKVIGTTRASVSPDLMATAIGFAFDLIYASSAKSQGFDHSATITRAQQGHNLAVMEVLRAKSAQACQEAKASQPRR